MNCSVNCRVFRVLKLKIMLLVLIALCFSFQACSVQPAKADGEITISCRYVTGWDFKRCENDEVVCYFNATGLSCRWKE